MPSRSPGSCGPRGRRPPRGGCARRRGSAPPGRRRRSRRTGRGRGRLPGGRRAGTARWRRVLAGPVRGGPRAGAGRDCQASSAGRAGDHAGHLGSLREGTVTDPSLAGGGGGCVSWAAGVGALRWRRLRVSGGWTRPRGGAAYRHSHAALWGAAPRLFRARPPEPGLANAAEGAQPRGSQPSRRGRGSTVKGVPSSRRGQGSSAKRVPSSRRGRRDVPGLSPFPSTAPSPRPAGPGGLCAGRGGVPGPGRTRPPRSPRRGPRR